jgi:hypothetical protein
MAAKRLAQRLSALFLRGATEFVWAVAGIAPLGPGECDAGAESGAAV